MAEHAAPGSHATGAPMDYDEHEQTYKGFVAFTKLAVITAINILLTLAIFAFGSGGAFWIGMLILTLAIAAAAAGGFSKGSWKPSGGVCILAALALVLTVA